MRGPLANPWARRIGRSNRHIAVAYLVRIPLEIAVFLWRGGSETGRMAAINGVAVMSGFPEPAFGWVEIWRPES